MNNQASGVKTFLVTLSVSLVIFGGAYYYITDSENSDKNTSYTEAYGAPEELTTEEKISATNDEVSPFGKLAETTPQAEIQRSAVLAGADTMETTESTVAVPDTGSDMILWGVVATSLLGLTAYLAVSGPRKTALTSFEQKFFRD